MNRNNMFLEYSEAVQSETTPPENGQRRFNRSPRFSLTIILTGAAAVGMAASVFSVLNAVLLRPRPYKDPARLASI